MDGLAQASFITLHGSKPVGWSDQHTPSCPVLGCWRLFANVRGTFACSLDFVGETWYLWPCLWVGVALLVDSPCQIRGWLGWRVCKQCPTSLRCQVPSGIRARWVGDWRCGQVRFPPREQHIEWLPNSLTGYVLPIQSYHVG